MYPLYNHVSNAKLNLYSNERVTN